MGLERSECNPQQQIKGNEEIEELCKLLMLTTFELSLKYHFIIRNKYPLKISQALQLMDNPRVSFHY